MNKKDKAKTASIGMLKNGGKIEIEIVFGRGDKKS